MIPPVPSTAQYGRQPRQLFSVESATPKTEAGRKKQKEDGLRMYATTAECTHSSVQHIGLNGSSISPPQPQQPSSINHGQPNGSKL
jgi:hypothetical protein